MMLIRWDDCIQETEGMRWKMILECRLKAVEVTSSISLTGNDKEDHSLVGC